MKNLILSVSLISIFSASAEAKDFHKEFKRQVVKAIQSQVTPHVRPAPHVRPPCKDPHRCPQPKPFPVPHPAPTCQYFLGVWTTLVQLAPPDAGGYEPQMTAYAAAQPYTPSSPVPAVQVVPPSAQPTYGLRIDQLVAHSAAVRAGLEPGDILLTANGRSLRSKLDLNTAIHQSQGTLELLVLDGRTWQVTSLLVTLDRK